MTPEEVQAIVVYLKKRVQLNSQDAEGPATIIFHAPTEDEIRDAGLNAEGVKQIIQAPWWDEMVEDIIETPEMCDEEDPPEQVLDYARDVVWEYINKRYQPNGK